MTIIAKTKTNTAHKHTHARARAKKKKKKKKRIEGVSQNIIKKNEGERELSLTCRVQT